MKYEFFYKLVDTNRNFSEKKSQNINSQFNTEVSPQLN